VSAEQGHTIFFLASTQDLFQGCNTLSNPQINVTIPPPGSCHPSGNYQGGGKLSGGPVRPELSGYNFPGRGHNMFSSSLSRLEQLESFSFCELLVLDFVALKP